VRVKVIEAKACGDLYLFNIHGVKAGSCTRRGSSTLWCRKAKGGSSFGLFATPQNGALFGKVKKKGAKKQINLQRDFFRQVLKYLNGTIGS